MADAFRLRVDVSSITALQRRFSVVANIDTRSLVERLSATALRQTDSRFSRRVAPDGSPWVARKREYVHPILERSRRLRSSIQELAQTATEAVIGTSGVVYAASHQYGYAPRNLPARPFLGFGPDDDEELSDESDAWLEAFIGPVLR